MMWSTEKSHLNAVKKLDAKRRWHKWFAWRPVSDGQHNHFFLEFVDRRYGSHGSHWSYRAHIDIHKDYYVFTATGSKCWGHVIDKKKNSMMFILNGEDVGYWMPRDQVHER